MKHFKETDLMVGDWVMRKNDHPIKIEEILINDDGYAINGIWDYHELRSWINIDDIDPIPLTTGIFAQNGFELRDVFLYHRIDDKPHHYDFKLKNGGVFTSEGYTLVCGIYHLTIRYVHELQHALRLCGLNDLADNFKMEE